MSLKHQIELPSTLKNIGDHAFSLCPLGSIEIPQGVTNVDSCAFYSCWELASVEIPASVSTIGEKAFVSCPNLVSVAIGGALDDYGVDIYSDDWHAAATTLTTYVTAAWTGPTDLWLGRPVKLLVITQQVWTVTFDAQGGVIAESSRVVTNDCAVGELPAATWDGHTLDGWFTAADGGSRVSSETVVTADVTFYARWTEVAVPPEPEPEPEPTPSPVTAYSLYEAVEGEVPTVASTYDGYLYDGDGNVKGSIQVKVGKPNANTKLASVKAVVIGLDGKKKNLKAAEKGKAPIAADGPTTVTFVGGDACEVTLGTCGMAGTYGDYFIDGALNVFMSKDAADKTIVSEVLGQGRGAVNVAWQGAAAARPEAAPYHTLTVTIAAKGKAKVAGMLADGAKVSATSQLVVGEEWCCVPVAYAKKGVNLAFNVWLRRVGDAAPYQTVVGLGEDVKVGKPGTLKDGAAFCLGAVLGDARYAGYLPDGMAVTQSGTKWTLPKAGKVQLAKDGTVDEAKLGGNPSALKLTYKAADGTFKGSFKAYADVNGKPKATTVNVTGVLVNGTGYGTAAVKKVAVAPVTIE